MPYPSGDVSSETELPFGYKLLQIQQLTRHGARYPNLGEMERISYVYDILRPLVPSEWIVQDLVDTNKAGLLAESGKEEIAGIAERTMNRYSPVFGRASIDPESVRFISSDKQRTKASAQIFKSVLSNGINTQLPQVTVLSKENDTTIGMHHACPAWIKSSQQLKEHEVALETLKFDATYGSGILWMINLRLGTTRSVREISDIDIFYRLCGYDLSLYHRDDRWCSLLDPIMSEYLELRRDIGFSRIFGPYGADINKKLACVLFSETLADIDSALANPATAVSTFRFGHAETMVFVSTLLQLENTLGKNNTPITGNMLLTDALDRGFRTTVLAPFATNLVIELYSHGRRSGEGYFRLMLNERVVRLDGCSHDICPVHVLRQKVAAHIGCNFNEMCQAN
ncbi:hypothetical protein EV175_000663 [Coemansia sp. RSA 1933]|nr:hypothetical protein EV175_000663 [Coemansia sp. RSA 1933]